MAINFVQGQVAVGDPNPGGPSATSNDKNVHVKVVKLTSANFSTTNVDTLVAILPADATAINYRLWVKTQLAGGSISAATVTLGTTSGGAEIMAANAAAFGAAGVNSVLSPVVVMMQNYAVPVGPDIRVFARGIATTGNPTSGEMYLSIDYVR